MSTNTATLHAPTINPTPVAKKYSVVTLIRHLLPAVATLGWIIGFTLGHIPFFETFGLVLCAIGIVAMLTVCPLKLFQVPLFCAASGFKICRSLIPVYGVADLCAAIFGFTGGAMLGLIAVCGIPVFFTLLKLRESQD